MQTKQKQWQNANLHNMKQLTIDCGNSLFGNSNYIWFHLLNSFVKSINLKIDLDSFFLR